MSYNLIVIEGRLTRDPELKATREGKSVCTFSVAVDRDRRDGETDFFECVAFEKQAETHSKYLKKGSRVLVQGRMQSRTYESRNGGRMTTWGINTDRVDYLSSKNENAGGGENRGYIGTGQYVSMNWDRKDATEVNDADLPF